MIDIADFIGNQCPYLISGRISHIDFCLNRFHVRENFRRDHRLTVFILDAGHETFLDIIAAVQQKLNFLRENILAVFRHDHIFLASRDDDKAIGINIAEIARMEETFFVDGLRVASSFSK